MDRGLNCAVLHIAGRLYPRGYPKGGPTIPLFGDEEVTWAFEAWTAWCDMKGLDPRTAQAEHLRTLYGDKQGGKWAEKLRPLHQPELLAAA